MRFNCFLLLLTCVLLLASCGNSPKVKTYRDAEREFRASLTKDDSLAVMDLCESFMSELKAGAIEAALSRLNLLDNSVVYKLGDETLGEMRNRFTVFPVVEYEMTDFNLSTPGNNDVFYRYSFSGPLSDGGAMKVMLNPVKVGDEWYLCVKDGTVSIHPDSPAPNPIRLNKQQDQ